MDWEGVIAIVGIFGMPVLIVFFVCLFRFLKNRMRHREVLAAIEKGIVLPESEVRKAVIPPWITSVAAGVGLLVFSPTFIIKAVMESSNITGAIGKSLFFLSIGLFFLIRGLLLRKHEKQREFEAGKSAMQ